MLPGPELERLFDAAVPLHFQLEVAQLVFQCYRQADTIRDSYGIRTPIAKWHAPYGRRALIESQLLELAGRYPGLSPCINLTKTRSTPYVQIQAGQFVITECKVDERLRLPREADHRSANSLVNYSLFAALEDSPPDATAYVILSHVPAFDEPRPAHIDWVFPDGAYSCILHHIDLLAKLTALSARPVVAETPELDPMPKLRKPREEKGEARS